MSGMLGSSGPGILGKLLAKNEKKYANVEKPGFSGTMRQNKKGDWYSVQARADKRRRRGRGRIIGGFAVGGIAPPAKTAMHSYLGGEVGKKI